MIISRVARQCFMNMFGFTAGYFLYPLTQQCFVLAVMYCTVMLVLFTKQYDKKYKIESRQEA